MEIRICCVHSGLGIWGKISPGIMFGGSQIAAIEPVLGLLGTPQNGIRGTPGIYWHYTED